MIAPAQHTERLGCSVSPHDLARFLAFVKADPASGCWEWIGHTSKKGYAQFWWHGRAWWAHRWSFALLAGEHSYGVWGALLAVPTASIIQSCFLYYRHEVEGIPYDVDLMHRLAHGSGGVYVYN